MTAKNFYFKKTAQITFLLLIFLLSGAVQSFTQVLNPVKWETTSKQINDTEFDLIFTAIIDDGWTIYSQYLESDDGPIATSFNYDEMGFYQLIGKNIESDKNRKEVFDKLFDMNVVKFTKKAVFTQRVKLNNAVDKPISGYLEFMTCDATKCLPPTAVDFEIKLESKAPATSTGSNTTAPPKKTPEPKKDKPTTNVVTTAPTKAVPSKPAAPAPPKTKPAPKQEIKIVEKQKPTKAAPKKETKSTVDKTTPAKAVQNTTAPANEGILDPVKWGIGMEKDGADYVVQFTANMDKNWNIYSQYTDDNGPVPTSFEFDAGDHFTLDGKVEEKGKKKEGPDPLFDNVNVIKYVKGPVTFTQRVKAVDASKPITGYLTYMTCDNARCLPPTEVDFAVVPGEMKALIGKSASDLIAGASAPATTIETATNTASSAIGVANIVGNVIDQIRPIIRTTHAEPVGDCGEEETTNGQSLLLTFIFGFLGGLVALLTPCVFPMIPLTVSYFTKGSKDRATGIKNGVIYGLSIIVIYVAIGLIITGIFGPTALNELSTNWIANVLFFLIFIFFAFSFFGYYEITLPSSWTNKTDSMADQGGLLGTFFMAFTLALVSFSCTGPIIGSALVASATDVWGPFTVMLGFSTALALPFGLFAAFPAWLNSLPSSGSWMTSVKVVLGFIELALAFKFLSVADMTMHWGILGYELFMGIWILLAAGMTAYLFGFIRFPHDSPLKKLSIPRWGFALASLALTLYLMTGFRINDTTKTYNSLALLSGIAPPAYYNYFLADGLPSEEIKAKYPSFTKCANDLDCFKDYYEGMSYAKEINKPVLLDFTGFGCVNCRKTEEHIWVEDKVRYKLKDDFVLISLYVDDRKELEDMLISKSREVKLRNVGNKWADFQIVNFDQNSQPLYVMMTPDEKVLAKPRGYKVGVDDYADFLSCGLQTYNSVAK